MPKANTPDKGSKKDLAVDYFDKIKKSKHLPAKAKPSKPLLFDKIQQKAKKTDLIRVYSDLSTPAIVKANLPSIASLKRQYSTKTVEFAIGVVLSDLSHSFNNALNDEQIEELAVECTSGLLQNITLEGVFLTCREIKSAKSFGKLDVNKVLTALQDHLDDQCEVNQRINYNKHLSQKHSRQNSAKQSNKEAFHIAKVMHQTGQLKTIKTKKP